MGRVKTSSDLIGKTLRCSGKMAIAANAVLRGEGHALEDLRVALMHYDNAITELHTHTQHREHMS